MKRYLHAVEDNEFTNADLIQMLKSHDINTTKHRYELKAKKYERYKDGPNYTKNLLVPEIGLLTFL